MPQRDRGQDKGQRQEIEEDREEGKGTKERGERGQACRGICPKAEWSTGPTLDRGDRCGTQENGGL